MPMTTMYSPRGAFRGGRNGLQSTASARTTKLRRPGQVWIMAKRIGIISDTHGLLRDQVKSRLSDCDAIIHAGDIGSQPVLMDLRQMAPLVVAVRGNVDAGQWAKELKEQEYLEIEGRVICVVHDISTLDPRSAGIDVVIHGHSHTPAIEHEDGILYINPGSAGPRRFQLPVSMAVLRLQPGEPSPELIEIPA